MILFYFITFIFVLFLSIYFPFFFRNHIPSFVDSGGFLEIYEPPNFLYPHGSASINRDGDGSGTNRRSPQVFTVTGTPYTLMRK